MKKYVMSWVGALFLVLASASAFAASVNGTIKFDGAPPEMKKIDMNADPVCAHGHSTPVLAETLVLGTGQTIGNIMVRVKSGLPAGKTYPVPTEPVVLNQKGCQYFPHVF